MHTWIACACALVALGSPASAQVLKENRTAPLKVVIVQGDGAFNDIRRKMAQTPVVEVCDEYDRRIPKARVVFTLPAAGAGGEFTGGARESVVAADEQGRASAGVLKPNGVEGRFPIRVSASADGRRGSAIIWQSNTIAGGGDLQRGRGKKTYIILGLLGGAAAGGVFAATRGGGKGGVGAVPSIPTSLSAGTITVGGPR